MKQKYSFVINDKKSSRFPHRLAHGLQRSCNLPFSFFFYYWLLSSFSLAKIFLKSQDSGATQNDRILLVRRPLLIQPYNIESAFIKRVSH